MEELCESDFAGQGVDVARCFNIVASPGDDQKTRGGMNDLVEFLCTGEHPVEVSSREKTREGVKEAVRLGQVLVMFTDTKGGTEIGIPVDRDRSDLRGLESSNGPGEIKLVGDLTLDYVPVTCVARIDLTSMKGEGHLEVREEHAESAVAGKQPG
jgi:hypothetical protein